MTASAETAAEEPRLPQRLPDFFIVGQAKSGTTALYTMLKAHPRIYMSEVKEPRFLASDLRDRFHIPATSTVPDTLEQYLALFASAGADQLAGEASPSYLTSQTAAAAIAELQPAARIIAILREPASFVHSLHLQFVQAHVETEPDLRKALALEEDRRQGRSVPRSSHRPNVLLYSEHVRYVEQLRRYHAVFAPEQVLVLIYDDFRRDNEATVRRVWRFLGVDENAPLASKQANPTVRVRAQPMHRLVHELAAGEGRLPRAVQRLAGTLAPRGMTRSSAVAIRDRLFFAAPRPPDEALMLELRRRFKGEVQALSEYLDRDLVTLWGYDRVE
jgi:Sulfotransferase family